MPLYTYRCHVCRTEWSLVRTVAERDQAAQCPRCLSWHTWKKPDAPNFQVKGFNAKNGYSK
jgi:putative FmdB family regulatory protein